MHELEFQSGLKFAALSVPLSGFIPIYRIALTYTATTRRVINRPPRNALS